MRLCFDRNLSIPPDHAILIHFSAVDTGTLRSILPYLDILLAPFRRGSSLGGRGSASSRLFVELHHGSGLSLHAFVGGGLQLARAHKDLFFFVTFAEKHGGLCDGIVGVFLPLSHATPLTHPSMHVEHVQQMVCCLRALFGAFVEGEQFGQLLSFW